MEKRQVNGVPASEGMNTFLEPMEVTHSLFRDLKLKRRKLSKFAAWHSDGDSVKSDKAALYFSSQMEGHDGYSSKSDDMAFVSSSECASSVTSLSDLGQHESMEQEDEEEAQRRFEAFTNQVKQDAAARVNNNRHFQQTAIPREKQVAELRCGSNETLTLSSKAECPVVNKSACPEEQTNEATDATTSGTATIPSQTIVPCTIPGVPSQVFSPTTLPQIAIPATGIPQVVAFAAVPGTSDSMMPQVVAMATIQGSANQPQVVALPLCSWPYDPMMLNRLTGSPGNHQLQPPAAAPMTTTGQQGFTAGLVQGQVMTNGLGALPIQPSTQTSIEDLSQRIHKSNISKNDQNVTISQNVLMAPGQQAVSTLIAPQVLSPEATVSASGGTRITIACSTNDSTTPVAPEYRAHISSVTSQMNVSPVSGWRPPDNLVPGANNLVPGANNLVPGPNNLVPGTNHLVPGANSPQQEQSSADKQNSTRVNAVQGNMPPFSTSAPVYQQLQFPQQYLVTEASQVVSAPGGVSVPSSSGGRVDGEPPTEMEVIICEICDDKATGLHYGIVTCEGLVCYLCKIPHFP